MKNTKILIFRNFHWFFIKYCSEKNGKIKISKIYLHDIKYFHPLTQQFLIAVQLKEDLILNHSDVPEYDNKLEYLLSEIKRLDNLIKQNDIKELTNKEQKIIEEKTQRLGIVLRVVNRLELNEILQQSKLNEISEIQYEDPDNNLVEQNSLYTIDNSLNSDINKLYTIKNSSINNINNINNLYINS